MTSVTRLEVTSLRCASYEPSSSDLSSFFTTHLDVGGQGPRCAFRLLSLRLQCRHADARDFPLNTPNKTRPRLSPNSHLPPPASRHHATSSLSLFHQHRRHSFIPVPEGLPRCTASLQPIQRQSSTARSPLYPQDCHITHSLHRKARVRMCSNLFTTLASMAGLTALSLAQSSKSTCSSLVRSSQANTRISCRHQHLD